MDISKMLAGLPHMAPLLRDVETGGCEIFGWVRGTSRVAMKVWGIGKVHSSGFSRDLFLDVATWTFSDGSTVY